MTPAQIVAAYLAAYQSLLGRTTSTVLAAWAALARYDEDQVEEFTAKVVPVVTAAQTTTAAAVDGYVARLAGSAPLGIAASQVTELRGVPAPEVYRRPFVTVWTDLANEVPWERAVEHGRRRLETIAQTDVQMAQRRTMQLLEENDRIVGYRRVLTGKSCIFCATASTQRYTRENLQPIHAHCDCGVAPIFGDSDPGRVVNDDLLQRLKARGGRYWRQAGFVDDDGNPIDPTDLPGREALEVTDHGELGPVFAATA